MSSYLRKTINPASGKFEPAAWIDDYFGPHQYGVKFQDGKVYKEDEHDWTTSNEEPKADWYDFMTLAEFKKFHFSQVKEKDDEIERLKKTADRLRHNSNLFIQFCEGMELVNEALEGKEHESD